MKISLLSAVLLFVAVFFSSVDTFANKSVAGSQGHVKNSAIVGSYNCTMSLMGWPVNQGIITFDASGKVSISGNEFEYVINSKNNLSLRDISGSYNYEYSIDGDKLVMNYSDGTVFSCQKKNNIAPGRSVPQTPNSESSRSAGGEYSNQTNWQLQGSFCTWSGSSGGGSSYSSSKNITFDGRGAWQMTSSSAYSGGGLAYQSSPVNSGSYRVQGQMIYYTTSSGEQGTARVNMQQSDGRITEIYIGGELYSPSLCQ